MGVDRSVRWRVKVDLDVGKRRYANVALSLAIEENKKSSFAHRTQRGKRGKGRKRREKKKKAIEQGEKKEEEETGYRS